MKKNILFHMTFRLELDLFNTEHPLLSFFILKFKRLRIFLLLVWTFNSYYSKNWLEHPDLISHTEWVLWSRAANAGTKSKILVLFCSAKTVLNICAMLDPALSSSLKGLLPTNLLFYFNQLIRVKDLYL